MLETPAGRIFWQRLGTGPRPALAVHCSLAHSGAWAGVAADLGAQVTITAFDMPGHGRSEDWTGGVGYIGAVADVILAFSERAGGPLDLVGHSAGGVAALRAACLRPAAFRTLTLIEPVFFAAAAGTAAWDGHLAAMAGFARAWEAGERAAATRAFLDLWGAGEPWESLPPRQRAYAVDRIHLIAAAEDDLLRDAGGLMARLAESPPAMPVMFISGGASPPIIPAIAASLAGLLPSAVRREVPGAGHMAPVTQAGAVAALIAENLSRG